MHERLKMVLRETECEANDECRFNVQLILPFDGIAKQKAAYLENGGNRSNAAYGYVTQAG